MEHQWENTAADTGSSCVVFEFTPTTCQRAGCTIQVVAAGYVANTVTVDQNLIFTGVTGHTVFVGGTVTSNAAGVTAKLFKHQIFEPPGIVG